MKYLGLAYYTPDRFAAMAPDAVKALVSQCPPLDEKMRASGKTTIYNLTPEESNEWKKALMPVHQEMESRVGKGTIEAVYKASGFIPPK